jgi:glutamyl-tRNA reductase
VYLYSVDDLREIVDQNMRSRRNEACKADLIIEEGVRQYVQEMRSLGAVDAVKEYRQMAEQLREQELQRALRALARGDAPQQIMAQLARTITNKLIHAPTAGLKQASAEGRLDRVASARKLLGLEAPEQAEAPTQAPTVATETDEQDGFDLPPSSVATSRRTLQ